jgi:cytochrome c-type biogenesis protein CcmH
VNAWSRPVLAGLAVAVLAAAVTPVVRAQLPTSEASSDPQIEAQTNKLASELRCPICQGLSIQDSPTELAHEMKGVIREQLIAGRTPDQVKQYFVERYGEWVLLRPPPSGFNLLLYVLPWLALLAGLGVIVLAVRRWVGQPLPAGESPSDTVAN